MSVIKQFSHKNQTNNWNQYSFLQLVRRTKASETLWAEAPWTLVQILAVNDQNGAWNNNAGRHLANFDIK